MVENKHEGSNLVSNENCQEVAAESHYPSTVDALSVGDIDTLKSCANASPPAPAPPENSPYICNMTVTKQLKRRGIGWYLLKASEKLTSQLTFSKDVYLHCRMIDEAPFKMYIKAGYNVFFDR